MSNVQNTFEARMLSNVNFVTSLIRRTVRSIEASTVAVIFYNFSADETE